MSQNIKNYIGVAGMIVALVFAYSYFRYTGAYERSIQPSSFRSFSASGEGKATVVPDVAVFNFTVITEGGKDLAASQKENTDKTNQAVDFVKSKGVEAKDIKTQSFNVSPRYESYNCYAPMTVMSVSAAVGQEIAPVARKCPPPSIVGYTITQSIEVKVRDFSKVGELLSGVVDKGANQVGQLYFKVDDQEKALADARAKAIDQAKRKADEIAAAGGFKKGRLLSIEESGYNPYPYDRYYGMGGDAMMESAKVMSAPAPSIEAGSQEMKVNVYLRYEIE